MEALLRGSLEDGTPGDVRSTSVAPKCGVVYVAFGSPHLAMALVSALSVRATNPGVPICMITNVTPEPPDVSWWSPGDGDRWQFLDRASADNRSVKANVYFTSPFLQTLYLDSDTLVLRRIDRLWLLLRYFDVLARPVMKRGANPYRLDPPGVSMDEVTHFNTGVLAFRRSTDSERLFRCWQERLAAGSGAVDQPAFVEALCLSNARIFPLRDEWNQVDYWHLTPSKRRQVVIWHYKRRAADRRIRALAQTAVSWFHGRGDDRRQLHHYFAQRWVAEGGPVRRRVRALLAAGGGSLSAIPERTVGRTRWREMIAPGKRAT
jgi:hypothetical protein